MKRLLLMFILMVSSPIAMGNDINIGVYRSHNIQRIDFSYYEGSYMIFGDTTPFGALLPNEFVSITRVGNKVELKKGVRSLGTFKDRKSTRLNSSHVRISYAVFCLKKKKNKKTKTT